MPPNPPCNSGLQCLVAQPPTIPHQPSTFQSIDSPVPFCSFHQLSKDETLFLFNMLAMIIHKQRNARKTQENREKLTGLANEHKREQVWVGNKL